MVKLAAFLIIIALLFGVGAVRGLFSAAVGLIGFVIVASIAFVVGYFAFGWLKRELKDNRTEEQKAKDRARKRNDAFNWLILLIGAAIIYMLGAVLAKSAGVRFP